MNRRMAVAASVLLVVTALSASAFGVGAIEFFDSDAGGFIAVQGPTLDPNLWIDTGGNPGGHIYGGDVDYPRPPPQWPENAYLFCNVQDGDPLKGVHSGDAIVMDVMGGIWNNKQRLEVRFDVELPDTPFRSWQAVMVWTGAAWDDPDPTPVGDGTTWTRVIHEPWLDTTIPLDLSGGGAEGQPGWTRWHGDASLYNGNEVDDLAWTLENYTRINVAWQDRNLFYDNFGFLNKGDANGDGAVGIADLSALADNYGKTPARWTHGEFSGDWEVGIADLSALADNYGLTVPGAAARILIIPEPATLLLLAGGAAAALLRRRR